jgi:probable phosphoglycerate mutase
MQGTPVQGELGVWPETLARWVAGETGYAPAGMESFDQIRARVLPVWDRITGENQGKTLAVVAHGIVIRVVLLSVVEGYNAADWFRLGRIANASMSEVTQAGRGARKWRAVRVGYIADEVRRAYESPEAGPGPA